MRGLVRDTDILVEAPSVRQENFLAPDFYLNCVFLSFFLLFNKRILLLILSTQTRQFRVLFVVEELYLSKTLYLRGKSSQLAVLTLNTSPITRPIALKCGSAWELVISVTLNIQRLCHALTGGLGGNEQYHPSPLGTWQRNKIYIYI